MPALTGSPQPVALGPGYAIRAPGLRGTAQLKPPRSAADRARARTVEDGTPEFERALAAANVTQVREVEVMLEAPPPGDAARSLRSADGQENFELQVPDAGPDHGQLVLTSDEGVLTWHLPVDEQLNVQPPATRGAGGVKRFRIPATRPASAAPGDPSKRSILGAIGKKLLKVLVYPITDPVVGAIGDFFAERWEERKRPYGVRTFEPNERRTAGAGAFVAADWERMRKGRALLFIHGTFSTAHGAFEALPDRVFAHLHDRYAGRVFAFNHFTLSHDPRRNAEWFLRQIPAGRPLEVDIVCHSRGGLVARALAERPSALALDNAALEVKRIAFVAVPNAGTLLAHPDHMVKMIDRLTTALNLFPTGPVAEGLEALLTAVKIIGHGSLKALDGLASMHPEGEFLRRLNQGAPAADGYHAVAADYEPTHEGIKALVAGKIADSVIDRVFQDAENDLVVPEAGVYSANGSGAFPVPAERLLRIRGEAGVIHTTVFGHAPAADKLLEWLV